MEYFFIIFLFSFVCYSATQFVVYLNGPFHIFEKFRKLMQSIHEQLGELISCEACTCTWLSFFLSALNILIIPSVPFTPFNLLLGFTGIWWLIILLDGLFGSGITWMLFRIEDALTAIKEKNQQYEEENG